MEQNINKYNAALYMRLSRDDDTKEESSSITNQRKMLIAFAKEHSFNVFDEYIDDGWSGTNFNRPNFKRMISDIEQKKVNLVITKDLSRLGRDYITTGQYTEIFFPAKKVRYIAINDGYDSNTPYCDIVPFKNVINEMYARDTSKKIRSAFITKMKEGSYIGNFPPYGYIKDQKNKNHLLIDQESAPIVNKIFTMATGGKKPSYIAEYLNKSGILPPSLYRFKKNPHLNINNYSKNREWTSAGVLKILNNIIYLGHTAQGKTTKISFKSKTTVNNPKFDWIIVKNTHEPIIDQQTFNLSRKMISARTYCDYGNFKNIFSGLAKCKDCKRNMSTVTSRKKNSAANLACGNYKLNGTKGCSNHFIDYNILYSLILNALKNHVKLSNSEKKSIISDLKLGLLPKTDPINNQINNLQKVYERINKINLIIKRLYEDNLNGIIDNKRLGALIKEYEDETNKLTQKLNVIDRSVVCEEEKPSVTRFFKDPCAYIDEYMNFESLTELLLFSFIDHIDVCQGYYKQTQNGKIKHQHIKIYFNFGGTDNVTTQEI